MAKTIDLNERALEKERTGFVRFCKICAGFCEFMVLDCLFLFIICGYKMIESIVVGGMMESVVSNAANLVACIGIGTAARFGMTVFSELRNGETPFRYDIGDKIKGASVPLVISGAIGLLIEVAVVIMIAVFGYSADKFDFIGGLDVLLFGLVLSALAYIFNYGCKLQQESDETI